MNLINELLHIIVIRGYIHLNKQSNRLLLGYNNQLLKKIWILTLEFELWSKHMPSNIENKLYMLNTCILYKNDEFRITYSMHY